MNSIPSALRVATFNRPPRAQGGKSKVLTPTGEPAARKNELVATSLLYRASAPDWSLNSCPPHTPRQENAEWLSRSTDSN